MARGVNKVILVGNLGNDPEVRYSQNGGAITTISLATSESWKDKDGNQQERTEWHRVKFFGRLAEIAGEYLKKGRQVYIEGSLRTEKYQDKQTGQDRYSTDIIANEMQMLGGNPGGMGGEGGGERSERPARAGGGYGGGRGGAGAARAGGAQGGAYGSSRGGNPPPSQSPSDPFAPDDDIPF